MRVLAPLPFELSWIDSRDGIFPDSAAPRVSCEHSDPVQAAVPGLAPQSRVLIMGKGLAHPVGTFWSCVMLLEHLGEHAAAGQLMQAIEAVTANASLHTRDLGGQATTAQVTKAVCNCFADTARPVAAAA